MINIVSRVVDWLRAGYPQGIPDRDYVPLLAVLRRRLTDEEITLLGHDLALQGMLPADHIDVGTGYLAFTDQLPLESEVERVMMRLRDAGWDTSDDRWRENPDSALG